MTTYYEEARDVLEDEGGSEEVPDVDVGFRLEAPDVGLLEVVLVEVLAPDVRVVASWESTKGLVSDYHAVLPVLSQGQMSTIVGQTDRHSDRQSD